ncbi:hypothetical protein F-E9_355 [Faustovirus]|nr:hypothetical protein F-E9_355 [Faustovirus]
MAAKTNTNVANAYTVVTSNSCPNRDEINAAVQAWNQANPREPLGAIFVKEKNHYVDQFGNILGVRDGKLVRTVVNTQQRAPNQSSPQTGPVQVATHIMQNYQQHHGGAVSAQPMQNRSGNYDTISNPDPAITQPMFNYIPNMRRIDDRNMNHPQPTVPHYQVPMMTQVPIVSQMPPMVPQVPQVPIVSQMPPMVPQQDSLVDVQGMAVQRHTNPFDEASGVPLSTSGLATARGSIRDVPVSQQQQNTNPTLSNSNYPMQQYQHGGQLAPQQHNTQQPPQSHVAHQYQQGYTMQQQQGYPVQQQMHYGYPMQQQQGYPGVPVINNNYNGTVNNKYVTKNYFVAANDTKPVNNLAQFGHIPKSTAVSTTTSTIEEVADDDINRYWLTLDGRTKMRHPGYYFQLPKGMKVLSPADLATQNGVHINMYRASPKRYYEYYENLQGVVPLKGYDYREDYKY